MSVKNSNDAIGNRTHDLPACSSVPQLTAPPRAPFILWNVQFSGLQLANYLTYIGAVSRPEQSIGSRCARPESI